MQTLSRFVSSALLLAVTASVQAAEIIPFRTGGWKYVLGTQEASNPTDAWRPLGFDDLAWLPAGTAASAPVGYPSAVGSPDVEGSIQTILPTSTAGAYTSVFLRKRFAVTNAAQVTGLTLQVQHDDGFVAWINGVEAGRSAGLVDPLTIATVAADHEVTVGEATLTPPAGVLTEGTNILSIQLFNSGAGSSDIFIDAQLTSAVDEAPTLLVTDPTPSSIVQQLTFIGIAFTVNESNTRATTVTASTTMAAAGYASNASCWLTKKGSC